VDGVSNYKWTLGWYIGAWEMVAGGTWTGSTETLLVLEDFLCFSLDSLPCMVKEQKTLELAPTVCLVLIAWDEFQAPHVVLWYHIIVIIITYAPSRMFMRLPRRSWDPRDCVGIPLRSALWVSQYYDSSIDIFEVTTLGALFPFCGVQLLLDFYVHFQLLA
jgi:hypothetical protein